LPLLKCKLGTGGAIAAVGRSTHSSNTREHGTADHIGDTFLVKFLWKIDGKYGSSELIMVHHA
jgi:hypothetical protein